MSFTCVYRAHPWNEILDGIRDKRASDVERALDRVGRCDLEDFQALVSPAAAGYLEPMAQLSHRLTRERFGRTIQMYAPLYLSNRCANVCTYCGFSLTNTIERKTLNDAEIDEEARIVKAMGFDHVLLVTGEWPRDVGTEYFLRVMDRLRPHFASISLEVQPLRRQDYERLIDRGLQAVYIYQETYDPDAYRQHHLKGPKTRFAHRLETPDRLGQAGIRRIGLGSLIGLSDWRADAWFVALHLDYLQRTYWQTQYCVSFPRLRPFSGGAVPGVEMTDRELAQLICAYRIWNPELELSLSTRESPHFRDHACKLGITAMSAGSRTNPGGYAEGRTGSLEQFEISDDRSPAEIATVLRHQGCEAVWKDWDAAYDTPRQPVEADKGL